MRTQKSRTRGPHRGHLPEHIRAEFGEGLDEYLDGEVSADRLKQACGRVWHCTIAPAAMHEAAAHIIEDPPQRPNYAALARAIRAQLKAEEEEKE
jgi:hypothetical protein